MLYFDSDYMEGAHPKILERLMDTNMEKTPGYGTDSYCSRAGDMIRRACGCPEARVYFMVGGTQTNAAVIDGLLKSWQGVVCAKSGHINTHEAGAIEHSGHKVISLKEKDGKLDPDCLETYLEKFFQHENREHMTERSTFLIPQNMVHCILPESFADFMRSADSIIFPYIWMEPGWDTVWRQKQM